MARQRGSSRRGPEFVDLVVERVRDIPPGCVATYGDIDGTAPRRVGYVLATTREELPWHRVVRADGRAPMGADQLARLRDEGVPLRGDRVDLARARFTASAPPVRGDAVEGPPTPVRRRPAPTRAGPSSRGRRRR